VRTALVAAWSESWVADTDRSRRLFRLLFDDDGLRATWFKVITESEAGWAQVIARRLGIDPNSQRAALIGAVVVAASRLSTKSFVDSGTDVDPDRRGHRRRDPHPGRLPACPHAYMYADYLRGDSMGEKNAHLQPMADAGVLRMVALDPGLTQFGHLGDDGLPSRHIQGNHVPRGRGRHRVRELPAGPAERRHLRAGEPALGPSPTRGPASSRSGR
jgi:hypothetical protein